MEILLIIAFAVAIVSVAVSIYAVRLVKKASDELDAVWNEVIELNARGLSVNGLDGVTFNKETKTLAVDGNIMAEGWIAAGGRRDEPQ